MQRFLYKENVNLITQQHPNVLDELRSNRVYIPDPSRIDDEYYRDAYNWLIERMPSINPYESKTVVWNWPGKRVKCSVRSKGDISIRYTVPRETVLFSEYIHWHDVLNSCNCTINEKEFDRLNDLNVLDKSTWERILDLNINNHPDTDLSWIGTRRLYQVTTWHIDLQEVDRIFDGRGNLLYTRKKGFIS